MGGGELLVDGHPHPARKGLSARRVTAVPRPKRAEPKLVP